MLPFLVLATWMVAGILTARLLRLSHEPPWSWFPLAAVLGPLWASVAADRRAMAATETVPALVATDRGRA